MNDETLPEFKIHLEPMSDEASQLMGFEWAGANVGQRSKIGGDPSFVQGPHVPRCPSCDRVMTFYAQLDSIGDRLCFADVGLLYVFVCFDCYETTSYIQSG